MGFLSALKSGYDDVKGEVEKIPIVGPLLSGPQTGSTSPLTTVGGQAATTTTGLQAQAANAQANPLSAPTQRTQTINATNQNQTRGQQEQAIQALQGAAAGTAPDAATIQLQQQAQLNNAASIDNAAALRGRTAGSSFAAANRQNALSQLQTNATAASQRAADMANARTALTGALAGQQTQDQGAAQAQAQLNQTAAQNNLQSQLTTSGQNITNQLGLINAGLTSQGQQVTAAGDIVGANTTNAQTQNSYNGGLIGGAGSALTSILSDKNEKTDISRATPQELRKMLRALSPSTFEYDDEANGEGERVGVMAQDMKKSKLGRTAVIDGKPMKLDVGNALGLALAALKMTDDRVSKLEARR